MFIFSGTCVFVKVLPELVVVYLSIGSSLTVYLFNLPSVYFGKLENVKAQPTFSATTFPSTTSPLDSKFILTESGRRPSWLFASSQTTLPETEVVCCVHFA